jgi:hypothetical protein
LRALLKKGKENVVRSVRASPPVVRFRSESENTERYGMTGALPVAT